MPTDEPTEVVQVRPARTGDLEPLTDLYVAARAAAEPAMPPVEHDAESVRAWLAGILDRAEVWVAEEDRPVGFAVLAGDWLECLYVAPDRQGEGIGTLLLDLVRAQRPGGFSLWVFVSNEPARAFYRRCGLVELEHTDGTGNEERAPDLRMVWPGDDPLGFLRSCIDEVDDELAVLLARRTALTGAVQDLKQALGERAGAPGRAAAREAEIVARMSRHVPDLGPRRIATVMHTVIAESLAAWEEKAPRHGSGEP